MLGHVASYYRSSLRMKISMPILAALLFLVCVLMLASDAMLGSVIRRNATASATQLALLLAEDPEIVTDLAIERSVVLDDRLSKICDSVRDVVAIAAYRRNESTELWTRTSVRGSVAVANRLMPPTLGDLSGRPAHQRITDPGGQECVLVTAPVTDASLIGESDVAASKIGYIVLALSLRETFEQAWRHQSFLLIVASLLVMMLIWVSSRVATRILRPLGSTLDAMNRVKNGHLGERIEVSDVDELGQLARHFNMMSEKLEENRAQIERHAAELEKRVEERTVELRRANDELRTLDEAKDAFLSNISHEMRTPLTSILASTEILNEYADEDPQTRAEFLEIVHQEAQRLTGIINSVLDLVKLEADSAAMQRRVYDLRKIVADVLDEFRPRAMKRDVVLIMRSMDEDTPVCCDAERIATVINHLLDNALKFSPEGATVDVELETVEDDVLVRVCDEGPGVAPEQIEKIFGKFGQGGTVLTSKPQGVGLGLAISSKVAQAHDGSLSYEDLPGWGATFVLRLPLQRASRDTAGTGPAVAAVSG